MNVPDPAPFDAEDNLDIDPMLFMQGVIDQQLEVLDMAKTGGLAFASMPSLGDGVADIARKQLERAQLVLDAMVAEDLTWSSSEWCVMVHEGFDTDGSEWNRCTIHGRMVYGDAYVCEGYEPPPYTGTH
jgi:hypothetical protein